MDATHIHLLLNHIPVIGTLIGGAIFAVGLLRRESLLQLTGLLTLVIISVVAVPVFLTGDGAEHAVEHLPGVSEAIIHEHEKWAEGTIWVVGAMGLLSAASFIGILRQMKFVKLALPIALLLTVASFALVAKTANLGGQIRHTEIRPGMTVTPAAVALPEAKQREEKEHN